jgi:transglutaminase-like putative cysteine protease
MRGQGALGVVAAVLLAAFAVGAAPAPKLPWLYVLEGKLVQETEYVYRVLMDPAWSVTATLPELRETAQPWYTVRVEEASVQASTAPSNEWAEEDTWGNRWRSLYWPQLAEALTLERRAVVVSEAVYGAVRTSDPYPLTKAARSAVPRSALSATQNIQKDDSTIVALAGEAVKGCVSELEAVARILALVGQRVVYACSADLCEPVYRVDAVYALELGKGNCVSYANLALALLRAAGIPAVAVNGFVADREESHASHAWISVYFPTWGWVEFESSDWMPAYGEAPRSLLMPQHITSYVAEERGVATAPFSEEHHAAFSILERPERKESVSATCRAGETVAWACSVEVPSGEGGTVALSFTTLPSGWTGTLSEATVTLDSNPVAHARDVLVAVTPPASAGVGQSATLTVRATCDGADVGTATLTVTVER